MYIKITPNIIEGAISKNEVALKLMEDMNVACRYGKHFFWGEIDTLLIIKENFNGQYPFLARLWNTFATQGAIAEKMLWHLEFELSDKKSYVKEENGKYTICIALNDINNFQAFNECHVVAENLDDIQMYQHILKYFKRENNLTHTFNLYYPILGGGSTTATVLKHEIMQHQSLVLGIVDSDKIFPTAHLKDTALKVKEMYDELQDKYHAKLYVLEKVMEVENLVPIVIYEKYCGEKDVNHTRGAVASHLSVIKEIQKSNETYLDFFDFKVGLHSQHLQDESKGNTNKDIVVCVADKLSCPISPCKEQYAKAVEVLNESALRLSPQKIHNLASQCVGEDAFVPGLGKNILRYVLCECSQEFETINKEHLTSTQQQVYMELGELMYNWTLAGEAMRI